jgi:nucleotide-binding universal stress UspA family protein
MFDKILFATTASPICKDAADVALDLAKKYNSQLTIFHVFGLPTHGFSQLAVDLKTGQKLEHDDEWTQRVKEEMQSTFADKLAEAEDCELEAVVGAPHREILRAARSKDVDLIVMGSHTRQEDTGAARFRTVVGNTMQKVAKAARCPVLIVSRPCQTCWWYFSNIVFGTDFSKAAQSAFKFALNTARQIGCKLYLFHACDIGAVDPGKVRTQADIEEKVKEARKKMEKLYLPEMEGFDNYEIEVWEGTPYVEILKYARDKQADLVVMAHHTREIDPEEAVLGSTVEQVVLRSACPVASVNRPDKVAAG